MPKETSFSIVAWMLEGDISLSIVWSSVSGYWGSKDEPMPGGHDAAGQV